MQGLLGAEPSLGGLNGQLEMPSGCHHQPRQLLHPVPTTLLTEGFCCVRFTGSHDNSLPALAVLGAEA
jgi:hypothetical protein